MKKKKELIITIDDISRSAWLQQGYNWDSISIEKITEKILADEDCYNFSRNLEDNGVVNDYINTEYMGYLIFHCLVTLSNEDLVNGINNALKQLLK